ncbi:MAG TPA: hypothetical protein PLV33_07765 [Opitutaceae bacterium]|nr:hypothetical protein [Opitutaceae bacterium]HOR25053.1 hypothetical protein [Opitutaceae bacterium]HPK49284.1 hypothetical protein [Opitutaceae bacterium]
MITNALVRIDGKKGPVPSPFEKPNPNLSFWVLELAVPKKEEKAQIRWVATFLSRHRKHITPYLIGRSGGALFLGLSSGRSKPVVFEPAFIQLLSDLGLGLEVYEEGS